MCRVVAYLFGADDGELDGRVELARYEAVSFEQGVSRAPYLREASHISHELVYVRLVQPLVFCLCDFIAVFTFITFFIIIFRDAAHPETDKGLVVAQIAVSSEPDDPNVPIYVAMGIIGALAIVYLVGTYVWRLGSRAWEEHQHKKNGGDALDSMYGGGQVPHALRQKMCVADVGRCLTRLGTYGTPG